MKLLTNLLLISILALGFGCAKKDDESDMSSGNSSKADVNISFGSYTTAHFSPMNFLVPNAYAAVSDLKFCFKRLRFKQDLADGVVDADDNIDLEIGLKSISNAGTLLGTVSVPEGTYKRIEFDLEPTCDGVTANSVSLVNDHGGFSSQSTITIKFEGSFIVSGDADLELGIQAILDAANTYNGTGSNLKDAMEAISGVL